MNLSVERFISILIETPGVMTKLVLLCDTDLLS